MSKRHLQEHNDRDWHLDAEMHGWLLPRKAPWPLRLPVVRWFRAMYHAIRVDYFAGMWASGGVGSGPPNQRDLWIIYAIARGWC